MRTLLPLRVLLVPCGLLALGIGSAVLFAPEAFHATSGIELSADPDSMSEVRAPGGALLALGALMLAGVFVRRFTPAAAAVGAAAYLGYGLSRLVSAGLDGAPGAGLVGAAVIELALGLACALGLLLGLLPGRRRDAFRAVDALPATAGLEGVDR